MCLTKEILSNEWESGWKEIYERLTKKAWTNLKEVLLKSAQLHINNNPRSELKTLFEQLQTITHLTFSNKVFKILWVTNKANINLEVEFLNAISRTKKAVEELIPPVTPKENTNLNSISKEFIVDLWNNHWLNNLVISTINQNNCQFRKAFLISLKILGQNNVDLENFTKNYYAWEEKSLNNFFDKIYILFWVDKKDISWLILELFKWDGSKANEYINTLHENKSRFVIPRFKRNAA